MAKINLKEIESLIKSAKTVLKEWDEDDNQVVNRPAVAEPGVDAAVDTEPEVEAPLEKQDSDLASVISTKEEPGKSPAFSSSEESGDYETVDKQDGFDIVQKKNAQVTPAKINLSSDESLSGLYDSLRFGEADLTGYPHWASEALMDGFAEQNANTGKWKLSAEGQSFLRDFSKFKQYMMSQFETENTLFEVRMIVRNMFEKDGTYKK
jgi:hypothetical protein